MTRTQQALQARLAGATWTQIAATYGYANGRSARSSVLWIAESDDQRTQLLHATPSSQRGCTIAGCKRRHYAHGWCKTHYARWQRHGTVDLRPESPLGDGFWNKVATGPDDQCWEWQMGRNANGYGTLFHRGHWLAHRLAWTLSNGPIPDGMMICHHCDNPPCCNPSHLFLGTALDNAADMVSKARQGRLPGSTNGYARLDEDKVRAIRTMYADGNTQEVVAHAFGIAQSTVSSIIRRQRWSHVA